MGSTISGLTNVSGTLFFAADDGVHGKQLWESNGIAAGTVMVADISPAGKSSSPAYLTNVNGSLFFSANDGTHGVELWQSNGTAAGTALVMDIRPGFSGSYPQQLTNINGTLFFAAFDGVHGMEPWILGPVPPPPPAAAAPNSSMLSDLLLAAVQTGLQKPPFFPTAATSAPASYTPAGSLGLPTAAQRQFATDIVLRPNGASAIDAEIAPNSLHTGLRVNHADSLNDDGSLTIDWAGVFNEI